MNILIKLYEVLNSHIYSQSPACSNGHLLVKDDDMRYYTCIICKRYKISQPSFFCSECEEAGCFACCTEEKDEDIGKKNPNCQINIGL